MIKSSDNDNNTLVLKFGGTSVGSVSAIRKSIKIVIEVKENWENVVVVISALSGVTDKLLESAQAASKGDLEQAKSIHQELRQRHLVAIENVATNKESFQHYHTSIEKYFQDYSRWLFAISTLGETSPRALDALLALGERLSVCIVAAGLGSAGTHANTI